MKSLRVFTATNLLLASVAASACWYGRPEPTDNMIYRLVEDVSSYYRYDDTPFMSASGNKHSDYTFRQQNISLWRSQTGTSLDDTELEQVIYKSTLSEMRHARERLVRALGSEAYDLLCLAKECEEIRAELADPWYYPSREYHYTQDLESIAHRATRYRGPLLGRYALQAVRALGTLRQDSTAVAYWEQVQGQLGDDVIRTMAERQVAAAYYNIGQRSKAMHIYAGVGDITSLYYIYQKENKNPYAPVLGSGGRMEIIAMVSRECPDSPFLKDVLQSILTHYDNDHFDVRHRWGCYYETDEERQQISRLLAIGREAIRDVRVQDKAMWYYVMAALHDVRRETAQSLACISRGMELCPGESFLACSFRVLRMYVEAGSCSPDAAYMDRLTDDLSWLMGKARKSITPQLRKCLTPTTVTEQWGDEEYSYTPDVQYYNQMYWSDALNRILSARLAPRLAQAGRRADALMVYNLGEYWLPKAVYGVAEIRNTPSLYWITERNNPMALLADSCSAADIVRMYSRLQHPRTRFDRLVARSGKTDSNYWADVIGTHYIAEHQYAEAARWLKGCSRQWQQSSGTWEWFDRDPFCLKIGWSTASRHHIARSYDYKLRFARRMAQLRSTIDMGPTADFQAEAMILYGVGMRNQTDWCWPLTRNYDYLDAHEHLIDREESQRWIDRGLALMHDKERKAYFLRQFGRNREVQKLCYDTKIAKNMRAHCDLWRDYKKK